MSFNSPPPTRTLVAPRINTPDLERQPIRMDTQEFSDTLSSHPSTERLRDNEPIRRHDDANDDDDHDEVDMLGARSSIDGHDEQDEEKGLLSGKGNVKTQSRSCHKSRILADIVGFLAGMIVILALGLIISAFTSDKLSKSSSHNGDKTGAPKGKNGTTETIPISIDNGKTTSSQENPSASYRPTVLSNGTHDFDPTLIVISLDGFRADYLDKRLSPALNSFANDGIRAEYLQPSFPTVTFPNHYTIVTGLYPESHGIVGNIFHDPVTKKEFHYTVPSQSLDPEWWGGEPIWVTAVKQKQKSAVLMWPGCAAKIAGQYATYTVTYQDHTPLEDKQAQILDWLDLPRDERPSLILAYAPEVDSAGHHSGPDSKEVEAAIGKVDKFIESVIDGITSRNLTEIVNIMVVSDHGMAGTSSKRLIYIDDYIDYNMVEFRDGWPLMELRPIEGANVSNIYESLKGPSLRSNGSWEVYMRDVDMPQKYHHSKNDRIAPIVAIPSPGWSMVTHTEFDVARTRVYHPRGVHGYSHESPLMRAIFVARGPAFSGTGGGKFKRKIIPPFQNTELYGLMARTLGLIPAPNNGTKDGLIF